jgi:hypothetical protein
MLHNSYRFSVTIRLSVEWVLYIYGCTALVDLGPFFSFLIYTQSVGLQGQGSACRKAATYTHNTTSTE